MIIECNVFAVYSTYSVASGKNHLLLFTPIFHFFHYSDSDSMFKFYEMAIGMLDIREKNFFGGHLDNNSSLLYLGRYQNGSRPWFRMQGPENICPESHCPENRNPECLSRIQIIKLKLPKYSLLKYNFKVQ